MKVFGKVKKAREKMSGAWAIEENAFRMIRDMANSFEKNPKKFIREAQEEFSSEEENKIKDQSSSKEMAISFDAEVSSERVLEINEARTEATINLIGPMIDSHDCITVMLGFTSYDDIMEAISEVESIGSIEKVVFNIDSPGGMVSGCDNVAQAIKAMSKPTEARSGKTVASAAYWLASQCDSITATSATAQFGSIGVVIEYWDGSRAMNQAGYDKVCITSTNASEKRVDPLSAEGEIKTRAGLDEVEKIFHRRVATGRGTTVSNVREHFGKGGILLAEKSLQVGMIDKTDFVIENKNNSNIVSTKNTEKNMTLDEFLAQNADAKGELDARIQAAVKKSEEKASAELKEKLEAKDKEHKELIDSSSKFLTGSYPDSVKELALGVAKGEKSTESLNAVVTVLDATNESKRSEDASEETEELGETPSEKLSKEQEGEVAYKNRLENLKSMKK